MVEDYFQLTMKKLSVLEPKGPSELLHTLQPTQSSTHCHNLHSKIQFNITSSIYAQIFPVALSFKVYKPNFCMQSFPFPVCSTYTIILMFLDFITLKISGEEHILRSTTLRAVTSPLMSFLKTDTLIQFNGERNKTSLLPSFKTTQCFTFKLYNVLYSL